MPRKGRTPLRERSKPKGKNARRRRLRRLRAAGRIPVNKQGLRGVAEGLQVGVP